MPEDRLERTRDTLPKDYQYGDAIAHRSKPPTLGAVLCHFLGHSFVICEKGKCTRCGYVVGESL